MTTNIDSVRELFAQSLSEDQLIAFEGALELGALGAPEAGEAVRELLASLSNAQRAILEDLPLARLDDTLAGW